MDEYNMTLGDFVEFAEVYPYTQDHYMMEKMFMEMDLIKLHLESYQFLLESNDVSLNQIDVLMVESGVNDHSLFVEELFIEKGADIFAGAKKIFVMIGKAIFALWKKVERVFMSGNAKADELNKSNEEKIELIRSIMQNRQVMEDLIVDDKEIEDLQKREENLRAEQADVKNSIDELTKEIEANVKRISNYLNGEDIIKFKPVPDNVNPNDAIRVVFDSASKLTGVTVGSNVENLYLALCKPEYDVEGLAIIANLESIVDEISSVIDLNGSTENASKIAYNSAKKLYKIGPDFPAACNKVKSDIGVACRTNKRFTMSEETIKKKLESAERLNKIFSNIINWTSFINMNNKNDAIVRAKDDPDIKKPETGKVIKFNINDESIDNKKFMEMYPVYLRSINGIAVTFQQAVATMTKALTAHIQLRESILNSHKNITSGVVKIIDIAEAVKNKKEIKQE